MRGSGASARADSDEAGRAPLAWLPDTLAMARIVLVLPLVWALWTVGRQEAVTLGERAAVAGLMAVIGLSDFLDGFLARRWRLTSARGAALDAAADKTALTGALVVLSMDLGDAFVRLPLWLLGVVLIRDLVLVAGWVHFRRRGRPEVAEHLWHGKVATVLLLLLLGWVVLDLPRGVVVPAAAVIALLLVSSAVGYVRRGPVSCHE